MANCNNQFLSYHTKISLPESKEQNIITKHNTLRKVIETYFKEKTDYKVPDFYIQGSYKMKTIIQKKNNTYDVDLGIYFREKPIHRCTTVQEHVLDAVDEYTDGGASHLRKCIRVIYANDFNIDLPVYYRSGKHDYIAVKNGDWLIDEPEKFIEWFNEKRKKEIKDDGQLVRIVKYLKRWADERNFKTPSGVALTVWVAKYFIPKASRDDLSLSQTIDAINNSISSNYSCTCPVQPYDNLVANLDINQKNKFKMALYDLCADARKASSEATQEIDALKLWKKHLGDKF